MRTYLIYCFKNSLLVTKFVVRTKNNIEAKKLAIKSFDKTYSFNIAQIRTT